MNILIKSCFVLCIISFVSCVNEISEDIPFEENYIVFGSISSQNEKVQVEVYKSSLLLVEPSFEEEQEGAIGDDEGSEDGFATSRSSKNTSVPVNDATIVLYTQGNGGDETIVTQDFDVKKGIYTSTGEIQGKIGETYWIEVFLKDGTKLVSEKEKLKDVVPLDKAEIASEGLVKTTFKDPAQERNLYLLEGDFTFKDILTEKAFTVSNDVLFDGNDQSSISIEVSTPKGNPLDVLNIRLSNVNFSTYQFYLNLQKQREENRNNSDEDGEEQNEGSPDRLFAAPSISLYGNIKNQSTGKRALGNFSVLAVSAVEL
jgi:hypothetical protein